MFELAMGGAKGEPGKIPRAAFEGARTITKATRTLWLVVLSFTTAMPCPQFSKIPAKIGHFLIHTGKVCTTEDSRCLLRATRVSRKAAKLTQRRKEDRQSVLGAFARTSRLCVKLHSTSDSPDPRSVTAFSQRSPLVPSIDKAWHRLPRQFPRYPDVPTKVHPQIPLETLQP